VKGYKTIIAVVALAAVAGFTQYAEAQLYDEDIPVLTAKNVQGYPTTVMQ
jgi:hypothetical protein